ncbi:MAG: PEGA domain-containing protein [Myxococcales bacterium]|nr:PEGA domain-containing protein [Myxococcales bacterium]
MTVFVCGVFAVALGAAPAAASNDLEKAQQAFDQAQADYVAEKFDEASDGFLKAYSARPFPQFLYNAAAAQHMKGKKKADAAAYDKAITYYKKYLDADKAAADRAKVEKIVAVLQTESARLKALPAATAEAPATTSKEVEQLGEQKTKGGVTIETTPQDATILLDGKVLGKTPWSGQIEGKHVLTLKKDGYKPYEKELDFDPTRFYYVPVGLAEAGYLGFLAVKANIPDAVVYIDDKVAPVGKAPYRSELPPGKHKVWVTAEGYDEFTAEVEIIRGQDQEVTATLKGSPVGYLNFRGTGIESARIYVDGKLFCERGPCRKAVPEGARKVAVARKKFKTYSQRISIQPKTETFVKVTLAPKPKRGDAVVAYIVAVALAGGGYWAYVEAGKTQDDIDQAEIDGVDPEKKFGLKATTAEKTLDIGSKVMFGGAGVTLALAIYRTFRDKGPASSAVIDVGGVAINPQAGPGYAGLTADVQW